MATVVTAAPADKGRFPEFPALDGFRGLAILLVLFEHAFKYSLRLPGPWAQWGGVGVILFFALSGFLITGLLCAEQIRTGRVDLRAFWARRGLRIAPAMLVYVAVIAVLKLIGMVTDPPWKDFAVSLAFLRNFAGRGPTLEHLWSVSLEQQFYLLWPLVFCRLAPPAARRAGWLLFAGVIIWRTFAISAGLYPPESASIYLRTDFRFDALMGGSVLALAWQQGALARLANWLRPAPPAWVFPALLAWAGWTVRLPAVSAAFITVQVLLALLLLARLVAGRPDVFHWLCSRAWLRWLGRRSYSLYLWQQLFLVMKFPDWGWARIFPVDLILAFVAGVASYHFVELPCLRLKSRWGGRAVQNGSSPSSP
jgi:peptidoglycan/LPS O-acetylase OafA/YrhL